MSREISVIIAALRSPGLIFLSTLLIVLCQPIGVFAKNASKSLNIVVLGDSLSAGYGLAPGEGFPEQLQKSLQNDYPLVKIENAGVSGDTTSGGLARLDWSVPEGTNMVFLELGANDALRGIPPQLTKKNLAEMITRLKQRQIQPVLLGMLAPPNMGEQYGVEFNAIYPALAKAHNLPLYPFFLEGVAGQTALNQPDGMHPNTRGIAILVKKFLPFVKTLINSHKLN